jgi:hypothetical protein
MESSWFGSFVRLRRARSARHACAHVRNALPYNRIVRCREKREEEARPRKALGAEANALLPRQDKSERCISVTFTNIHSDKGLMLVPHLGWLCWKRPELQCTRERRATRIHERDALTKNEDTARLVFSMVYGGVCCGGLRGRSLLLLWCLWGSVER